MTAAWPLPHHPAPSVQPSSAPFRHQPAQAPHPSQPSLSLLNQFSPRDHNIQIGNPISSIFSQSSFTCHPQQAGHHFTVYFDSHPSQSPPSHNTSLVSLHPHRSGEMGKQQSQAGKAAALQ